MKRLRGKEYFASLRVSTFCVILFRWCKNVCFDVIIKKCQERNSSPTVSPPESYELHVQRLTDLYKHTYCVRVHRKKKSR